MESTSEDLQTELLKKEVDFDIDNMGLEPKI